MLPPTTELTIEVGHRTKFSHSQMLLRRSRSEVTILRWKSDPQCSPVNGYTHLSKALR
jgi:hypothetical protein